jgi:hypothetical protein
MSGFGKDIAQGLEPAAGPTSKGAPRRGAAAEGAHP